MENPNRPDSVTDLESLEKNSETILLEILYFLNNFNGPDMKIIELAHEYIARLKIEGMKEVEENIRDGAFSVSLKKKLVKRFRGCVGCGGGTMGGQSRHQVVLQPHHITPREFGGKTTSDNAMIVCRDCHVIIHNF